MRVYRKPTVIGMLFHFNIMAFMFWKQGFITCISNNATSDSSLTSPLKPEMLLLLVTRPLPRDGGMAEDHGAPEAGQLPKV